MGAKGLRRYMNEDGSISHIMSNGMIWNEPAPHSPPELWESMGVPYEDNPEHREQNLRYLEEAKRWFGV